MIHKHILEGCSPTPLAHYLKALGILRLVSQQKDKNCRGAWNDDRFVLATTLTREELETFFLEEYKPTAIMDPWNGGSGFYPKDNAKAMDQILRTSDSRFEELRITLSWAKKLVGAKKESPSNDDKTEMQAECLATLRGPSLDAVQAAYVLSPIVGKRADKASYPSLLGTGWNDGRLDFANNFHQRIADIFGITRKCEKDATKEKESIQSWREAEAELLRQAFWKKTSIGLKKTAIGQYLPGSAGGANSTTGSDGDSLVNPWDFVLMLEGAILFAASATKRTNPQAAVQAAAPFALRNQAASGSVISTSEESQRGEQWMPLWDRFLGCRELQAFLAEGRAQIGRSNASRPVDMARSIARLGVARGITSFQRFGYLERNGQANFAVPLDRVDVRERPRARLIDEISPWLDRLHRLARDRAPARLIQAERRLADAVFAALTHDDTPRLWQEILLAAVEVEGIQATGTGFACGPIPRLSPEWVVACLGEVCGPEERLAAALGSVAGAYGSDGTPFDRIRHHWLPLQKFAERYATGDKRLAHDVRVVAHGRDPEADLISVLARRMVESGKENRRHPSLVAAASAEANLGDLAAWISGEVDVERCIGLSRAFMAVDWKRWIQQEYRIPLPSDRDLPEDAWMVLKLNALPSALDAECDIPFDPAILRRLETGNGSEALRLALCRLNAHGIHSALSFGMIDASLARRFASALAFPISRRSAKTISCRIQPTSKEIRNAR